MKQALLHVEAFKSGWVEIAIEKEVSIDLAATDEVAFATLSRDLAKVREHFETAKKSRHFLSHSQPNTSSGLRAITT